MSPSHVGNRIEVKHSATSGPEVLIFNRFAAVWGNLDHKSFKSWLEDPIVRSKISHAECEAIKNFCNHEVQQTQIRADYKELLQLTITFLGEDGGKRTCGPTSQPGKKHLHLENVPISGAVRSDSARIEWTTRYMHFSRATLRQSVVYMHKCHSSPKSRFEFSERLHRIRKYRSWCVQSNFYLNGKTICGVWHRKQWLWRSSIRMFHSKRNEISSKISLTLTQQVGSYIKIKPL